MSKEYDLTVEERVRNGARLLDWARPGWREEIDPTCLVLEDPAHCILGQLYGGYLLGVRALLGVGPESDEFVVDHGFESYHILDPWYPSCSSPLQRDHAQRDYDALDAEWRRVLGVEVINEKCA